MHFAFHKKLIIEPHSKSPVKTVFGVLKFAAKHKHPVRRSAFTYCEDERPSRLDLGKAKYGGPFTTENVEDVKTCLRMTLIIGSIIVITIPAIAYKISLKQGLLSEFKPISIESECYHSLFNIGASMALWGTVFLLVYEAVIHPIVKKYTLSTLKKIGIAILAAVASNIVMLVASHPPSGICSFTQVNVCLQVVTQHHTSQFSTSGLT